MTNQEIFELLERFDRSTALGLKLTRDGCSLELDRRGVSAPASAPTTPPVSPPAAAAEEASCVRAPLVGCYYAAPAPDQPPFVRPGDRVVKGQTLCLIEAMKMMSEVVAPCDCIIEEVLQTDGALLAFDAPLFRYRAV